MSIVFYASKIRYEREDPTPVEITRWTGDGGPDKPDEVTPHYHQYRAR